MSTPDYFERLGLPRRFPLDPNTVEREYLSRSRELHPDYHQTGSTADRRASLELTASLNEAYVTLRDPFRRAEYLMRLLGGPTAQQEKNLDQSFLMEMMDIREQIEAVDATGSGLEEIETQLTDRLAGAADRLADLFAPVETDRPSNSSRTERLLQIRKLLNAVKTMQSLLRDVATKAGQSVQ